MWHCCYEREKKLESKIHVKLIWTEMNPLDPTYAIFLKSWGFKDVKYDILVSHEFKESTMNPRFPSSALFWANFPESVLLTLGSHRSHKVAGASEDYDKKSGIPLTPPRSPWHPPDTRPKSNPWHPWDGDPWMLDQSPPNPPTTQIDILLTHLIRFVGNPLLPGKSGQE